MPWRHAQAAAAAQPNDLLFAVFGPEFWRRTAIHFKHTLNFWRGTGPDYQDFVETQTATPPGPNALGNCKDSNYIVKRRISRRTDARVSTIEPPVAQIKPAQSAKFHASLIPYYTVNSKVYWKAFDRSDKEAGTWKLDADTHWATFTPPSNAYPASRNAQTGPHGHCGGLLRRVLHHFCECVGIAIIH